MIAIVGAGLAGLSCAQELQRQGREFVLFEAADEPGGRVRSEVLDGFVLDRGFQVILSSYPAVSDAVDIPSLRPRFFAQGALIWSGGRLSRLESPLASPGSLLSGITTRVFSFSDKARLALVLARLLVTPDRAFLSECRSPHDVSVANWVAARGFSPEFSTRFLQPFFGGVLLDNDLGTSAGLFRYYLKKFATGRAWIPAAGIAAFPRAMADSLPRGAIRFGKRVCAIDVRGDRAAGLVFQDGTKFAATSIVLALDEPSLAKLAGCEARPGRAVTVVYFKSPKPLYHGAFLVLPEGKTRLVRHFAQVTNVAPELAPAGWHLISASVLEHSHRDDLADAAAREINEIFPDATLSHLATIRVPYAVPTQSPGFAGRVKFPTFPKNVHCAGDWATGASIQSALESGKFAAAFRQDSQD